MKAKDLIFSFIVAAAASTATVGAQEPNVMQRLPSVTEEGTPSADPLEFYRKNPELMKRYFPHLFQPQAATNGIGGNLNNQARNSLREAAGSPARPAVIPRIEFQGGTPRTLIDELKMQAQNALAVPPPLNAIIAPEMEDVHLPAFDLQNVTFADVFQALNKINEGQGAQWQLSGSTEPIWILNPPFSSVDPLTGMAVRSGGKPSSNAKVAGWPTPPIIDPVTGLPVKADAPMRIPRIFPLHKYLEKYKVEDITTAIQTAWGMMDAGIETQLKFHKDTNLLIAVGSPEQLSIINEVLRSLEQGLADFIAQKMKNSTSTPKEVFINGQVNKPGRIQLESEVTVMGAIARAGGLTPRADENKIRFVRPGQTEKVYSLKEVKNSQKIVLEPGDIIEVGEKPF